MKNFRNNKIIYILASVVAIIICIIVCFFIDKNNQYNENTIIETSVIQENNNIQQVNESVNNKLYIHISGEVNCPGVIEINNGSRIIDVIESAGGLTANADTSNVNLAYQVEDGQKIVIPSISDKDKELSEGVNNSIIQNDDGGAVMADTNENNLKININKATQSELESITGIGSSTASKIIEYRKLHGKFNKIEDIKNVSGIGNAKFEGLKDQICVKWTIFCELMGLNIGSIFLLYGFTLNA